MTLSDLGKAWLILRFMCCIVGFNLHSQRYPSGREMRIEKAGVFERTTSALRDSTGRGEIDVRDVRRRPVGIFL
jgi:hypothetical protein